MSISLVPISTARLLHIIRNLDSPAAIMRLLQTILGGILLILMGCACAQNNSLSISVGSEKLELPFWPAIKNTKGGVVLVQGEKAQDGGAFLRQLGVSLASQGWSCILLDPKSKTPWLEQLPEAMSNMRQQKGGKLVVVFYDANVGDLLNYFSKPQGKQVNGLILISAYNGAVEDKKESKESTPEEPIHARKLTFPIYDIVGQFDYPIVITQAQERMETFKDVVYEKMVISGADHDYVYRVNTLAAFLSGWMDKLSGTTISRLPFSGL